MTSFDSRSSHPTSLRPLSHYIPSDIGKTDLRYDISLKRSLRLRDCTRAKLSPEIHKEVRTELLKLDKCLAPFRIVSLTAQTAYSVDSEPHLNLLRLGTMPAILFAYAAAIEDLQGLDLELRMQVRLATGSGATRDLDTIVDVRAAADAIVDTAQQATIADYSVWVTKIWGRVLGSTFARWLIASGVTECCLSGCFRPDRSRQLSVLAAALADPTKPR